MIESLTIKKLDDVNIYPTHLYSCPQIVGKTFNFKQGLNVVCGYNGCGKSTLLHLIRRLTFCVREQHSAVHGSFISLIVDDMINDGLYDNVVLKNDWNKSVFSLRPSDELDDTNWDSSIKNMSQRLGSKSISSGMNTFCAVVDLLETMVKGLKSKNDSIINYYDTVTSRLTDSNNDAFKRVLEYQSTNHVDNTAYTVLLDEPDKSLDIMGIESLYDMFAPKDTGRLKHSFICVFHNPMLIYKLLKDDPDKTKINWIDLTDGYLDNIVRFVENKRIVKPSQMYWLNNRGF